MKYRIEFGFGVGEDRHGVEITKSTIRYALENIGRNAARLFGGYTFVETRGGWINPAGRLVVEPGHTLIVYVPDMDRGLESPHVRQMVDTIKLELIQAAVCVCITTVDCDIL